MDRTKVIVGVMILIADVFLFQIRKSQLFINGIAKQSPSEARFSKGKYWTVIISFLVGGIYLIIMSLNLA